MDRAPAGPGQVYMFGPQGSGKSSFIRTCFRAVHPTPRNPCNFDGIEDGRNDADTLFQELTRALANFFCSSFWCLRHFVRSSLHIEVHGPEKLPPDIEELERVLHRTDDGTSTYSVYDLTSAVRRARSGGLAIPRAIPLVPTWVIH